MNPLIEPPNRCRGCNVATGRGRVFCTKCWAQIPRRLKLEIWRAKSKDDLSISIAASREAILASLRKKVAEIKAKRHEAKEI